MQNKGVATIIKELIRTRNYSDRKSLDVLRRRFSKDTRTQLLTNTELIESYRALVLTEEIKEDKDVLTKNSTEIYNFS